MAELVATCLWGIGPDLLLALDAQLGPPVDSYVNGSQTWLTDDGPRGVTLEWRLHPVAGFTQPPGLSHYDLWESVIAQLSRDSEPADGAAAASPRFDLGDGYRTLEELWDGLECFPAYGDPVEPAPLADAAGTALGVRPERAGLVDHERIADAWEHAGRKLSIIRLLEEQLIVV